MKERPILFSAPMVRAILEGRKTQTRRVVKPNSGLHVYLQNDYGSRYHAVYERGKEPQVSTTPGRPHTEIVVPHCPYGQPGDRLWVREAWGIASDMPHDPGYVEYRADCTGNFNDVGDAIDRWRPSIHMPRSHSRITLEVTDVRVERLQDISEAAAIAEGADPIKAKVPSHRHAFRYLWGDINGLGAWDANPWVWVVSFQRVRA